MAHFPETTERVQELRRALESGGAGDVVRRCLLLGNDLNSGQNECKRPIAVKAEALELVVEAMKKFPEDAWFCELLVIFVGLCWWFLGVCDFPYVL